jgi:hypothetical protein
MLKKVNIHVPEFAGMAKPL